MNMKLVNAVVDIRIALERMENTWKRNHPEGNQRDFAQWQAKPGYAKLSNDLLRLDAKLSFEERYEVRLRLA